MTGAGTISTGVLDGRAYAVSYNRPIAMNSTTNSAGPADFLFGEEYAAIYWLEENGYNVSYISGIDAATNGSLLLNAKIYIDVGHDEYWTQSQYANVQAAANAGVNLAFLSGNNTYWACELAADINNVPNRTLVQYKDIQSGQQLDPNGPSNGGAGLFRDPTYGLGTPENALVGTIFTVNADGTLKEYYDTGQHVAAAHLEEHLHRGWERWYAHQPARLRMEQRSRQRFPPDRANRSFLYDV